MANLQCPNCASVYKSTLKACPCCNTKSATLQQKFRNVKTRASVGGKERVFDSRGESSRAKALEMMQKAGEISELKLQPKFALIPECKPAITYSPDFQYMLNGETVVEDFKSFATEKSDNFRFKKRLWKWRGPYPLLITMMKTKNHLETTRIEKGTDPIAV